MYLITGVSLHELEPRPCDARRSWDIFTTSLQNDITCKDIGYMYNGPRDEGSLAPLCQIKHNDYASLETNPICFSCYGRRERAIYSFFRLHAVVRLSSLRYRGLTNYRVELNRVHISEIPAQLTTSLHKGIEFLMDSMHSCSFESFTM